MKKRLFSLLLALCMIVSVFPVSAWATETEEAAAEITAEPEAVPVVLTETEEEEEEEDDYPRSGSCGNYTRWELTDQGKLIITGDGKIEGGNSESSAPWYDLRKEITSLELSDSITYIGHNAFNGCVNLTEVDLPFQLEKIGDAFGGCTGLKKITFYGDAPEFFRRFDERYTFEGVTATCYYPAGNSTWTSDVMQNYGGNITWESYDYNSLVLASGSCGENATYALTGSGILTISGSGPMTDFPGWSETPWYAYMETVKKILIEDGITTIGDFSFNGCNAVTEISIPDSVVHIGHLSMTGCRSLTSVDIPDGVTVIEEGAFGTSGLTQIDLPDALTEIGNMAFNDTAITSVVIPAGVRKIGEMAFSCDNLKEITFEGDAPNMMEGSFWGVSATAYYPSGNATWTDEVRSKDYTYDEPLKWVAYCPGGHNFVDGICTKCGSPMVTAPVIKASNVASTGKAYLTWSAVEGAASYNIYIADRKAGTYELLTTVTTNEFIHSATAAGDTFYYYVTAVADDGTASGASNIVGRTCDLEQPVMTVSNVASTGKVKISWKAVDGAVKYQVYRANSKNGTYKLLSTTTRTAIANTSAVTGETYYYKVRAIANNSSANSAYSAIKGRTCDLPYTTVTVSNVASTGKVRISWTPVEGAVKYQVFVSTSKDGTYKRISTTAKTAITNTSAEAGVTYYYKVKALAAVTEANSAYSVVKARTCDLPQPEIAVTLNSKGQPRVVWEAIEGAVKYEVYRSSSQNGTYSKKYTTSGTSYTNSGAASGKIYYYKVKAIAENSSANSALSVGKCPALLLDQPEVSITLNSKGQPRLTWNAVKGAVKYEVYRATSRNGSYSLKYTTSGTSYTNSGAEAGTTYYYKVKAIAQNASANSLYSEIVFISCSTVGFENSVAVPELIDCLNEYREAIGYEKVEWYEEGLDAAKIRAAELNVLPSAEERPDGSSPEDLWIDYGVTVELCLITREDVTAEEVMDALMLSEEMSDYGVICLLDIWTGAVAARNGDYRVIMFVK